MKMNQEQFKVAMENGDKPLVAVFSAAWCGPCKMFSPVLDKAGDELGGKYNFAKVDVDESPKLAAEYEVMTVPTIVVIKGGAVVAKKSGAFPNVALLGKWIEGVL